jgi:hypothetical protein
MERPKLEVKLGRAPSWDSLYEIAANQQGCFTREQAREAGFSDQLLYKHVHAGNLERVQRGIYRVTRFPESGRAHEDLVILWLWSGSEGVFSHETALRLHGLSDTLPSKNHLTLPVSWRDRQLTPPPGTRLSFADVPAADRGFIGAIPVTRPARTINDVATASGDAIVVEASVRQAIQRGLAAPGELLPAVEYLAGFKTAEGRMRSPASGSWLLEVVSGTCASPPRADWRVDAEDLATSLRGSLRSARYEPGTRAMTLEVVWPMMTAETRCAAELRSKSSERFEWVE